MKLSYDELLSSFVFDLNLRRYTKGIDNFFRTHTCSELCESLKKRWIDPNAPSYVPRARRAPQRHADSEMRGLMMKAQR